MELRLLIRREEKKSEEIKAWTWVLDQDYMHLSSAGKTVSQDTQNVQANQYK